MNVAASADPQFSGAEPIAVVIGMCGHGLAIARALHRQGVKVVGLERDTTLPGTSTNSALVLQVPDINGDEMVQALLRLPFLARPHAPKPVLFTTNDRMVATLARRMGELQPHFDVSWADSADHVLRLLRKDAIEAQSVATGLHYPKSRTITRLEDLEALSAELAFPVIYKPAQPISAFKTIVADSMDAVRAKSALLASCMPIIAQEFIPGDDTHIHFGALMMRRGQAIARFEGRKLRSRPMGHTTVAVSDRNEDVHALAMRFFEGLAISGPVSLELKRDPQGRYWVIEPTVGRTDFWLDLCIRNGVDLPLAEYFLARGVEPPASLQTDEVVWLNGQRDPYALVWLATRFPKVLFSRRPRSLFLDASDRRPILRALGRDLMEAGPAFSRRLAGLFKA